jgi:hypothetical protein
LAGINKRMYPPSCKLGVVRQCCLAGQSHPVTMVMNKSQIRTINTDGTTLLGGNCFCNGPRLSVCIHPSIHANLSVSIIQYHPVLITGSERACKLDPRSTLWIFTVHFLSFRVCISFALQSIWKEASYRSPHILKNAAVEHSSGSHTVLLSTWNACSRHALDIEI